MLKFTILSVMISCAQDKPMLYECAAAAICDSSGQLDTYQVCMTEEEANESVRSWNYVCEGATYIARCGEWFCWGECYQVGECLR